MHLHQIFGTCLTLFFFSQAKASQGLSEAETLKVIKILDERETNAGDIKATSFIKETERNKATRIFQVVYYRRDLDNKILILFTKPKEDAGKGYLKIDKNLWMYEPATGKWERRTEREKLAGTNSRRSDFDESRLAQEYNAKYLGEEKLAKFDAWKFELNAKEGVDVAYPRLILFVDKSNNNLLKREEYSLSGKVMRTLFYPSWIKQFSKSKKAEVWVPKEMRIIDEVEKGNSTIILVKDVDLSDLPDSMFSKAWVEGKSR